MRAFADTRPKGIVERLLGDRHSLPLSIVLHLVPGVLIVAAYLLIGEPLVKAIGYPAFMGWAIALCLVLMPVQLGLLWLGRKRNGRFSLRGVLHYIDKPVPRGKLAAIVILLIAWMMALGFALAPLNNFFKTFFTWLPYADTGGSGNNTYLDLAAYSHSITLTTMVMRESCCWGTIFEVKSGRWCRKIKVASNDINTLATRRDRRHSTLACDKQP
ncbi:hypothetical protein [Nocardia sp. NPDC005998]|uniref:hypothetical protein n=1 Tax=Nocardia sp. NPDC005998 TaxID=3156894 RepID=UPI0033AA90DF